MTRALVLGVTGVALSVGAASAQVGLDYAPNGYGNSAYAAPLYDYAAPAYGYSGPMYGYSAPIYGYSAPTYGYSAPTYGYSGPMYGYSGPTGPVYGYSGPAYGPATGQPPVAGETAEIPPAGSIPSQNTRHRRSMYMSAGGGSTPKKGAVKTGTTNGGY